MACAETENWVRFSPWRQFFQNLRTLKQFCRIPLCIGLVTRSYFSLNVFQFSNILFISWWNTLLAKSVARRKKNVTRGRLVHCFWQNPATSSTHRMMTNCLSVSIKKVSISSTYAPSFKWRQAERRILVCSDLLKLFSDHLGWEGKGGLEFF